MNVALCPQNLGIISLCTGGGGLDLGIELAIPSARSIVLVEREAFACSHLVSAMQQGLMAEAALWSDVTTFDGRPWRGLVDGLIGGIPCQPHSLAGKRLGEDDERDLWSDARRILVQSGAWFVLIENVRGMLSSGGAERVWRDLHRLGFQVEGGLFTAAEVGASHERERIFIFAVADRRRSCEQRWRTAGYVPATTGTAEGQGHQWQRDGHAASDGGEVLAHAVGARGAPRISGQVGPNEEGYAGESFNGGDAVVYATNEGRRRLSIQPRGQDEARAHPDGASLPVVYAIGSGHNGRPDGEVGRPIKRAAAQGAGECPSLFPPGPSDLRSWASVLASAPELEPAFRRVADGLASRLDVARVDRLRMLGNGVVSLQAAYALRTLATRLAARGSAGATRLVSLMGLAA